MTGTRISCCRISSTEQPLNRRELLLRSAGAVALAEGARRATGPSTAEAGVESSPQDAIWDAHVHLTGAPGAVEQRIDNLLKHADRLHVERLVVFMGTSFIDDPSPEQLRQQNDEVLRAIAHAPDRVLGMAYLNPKHGQASLAELDRCVRDGPMVGIKLWIAIRCNAPELDPIVRRAVELQIPIMQHCYDRVGENLPGESHTADMAELAARHPDAKFVCQHTGNDWERGIRTVRACRNVWAEVSGSDPTAGFVEMAVRELGPQRVIYGSDAGGRSFASQLAKVYSAELPDQPRRLILGENLRMLLQPVLAKKGVKL